jgi:hypothetical protein
MEGGVRSTAANGRESEEHSQGGRGWGRETHTRRRRVSHAGACSPGHVTTSRVRSSGVDCQAVTVTHKWICCSHLGL